MLDFGNDWNNFLKQEYNKDYYQRLRKKLIEEYKNFVIYPQALEIFNALKTTDYEQVKVVILGQDPYHQPNQAHGFCFSVQNGVAKPPSLRNIFRELYNDLSISEPSDGNLENWAKNGVLLLNTVLTVRKSEPNSHKNLGWQIFTDEVIKNLNERYRPVVFLLWGNNAASKENLINKNKHFVLKTSHPSPLSANYGFVGCKHFSKANEILRDVGCGEIDWKL